MTLQPASPFGAPLERIPLPDAPIERVISQIRFPDILKIRETQFIAPFQEAIRGAYPLYEREDSRPIRISPDHVTSGEASVNHRFESLDQEFRVSLAPNFLSLEQRGYESREVFLERLGNVTQSLIEHLEPSAYLRFGIRYVDRLEGPELQEMRDLMNHDLLGALNHFDVGANITRAMTEIEVTDGDLDLTARWGYLPAGDPFPAGKPSDAQSFILDLDGYVDRPAELRLESILELATSITDMIYHFFRWSVQDEFLRRFGAKL